MNITKFTKIMLYYQSLQPYRSPDFSNPGVIDFWFKALGHVGVDRLKHVMDHFALTSDHFPALKEIRESLGEGDKTGDAMSRDISARIVGAISKFGYANSKDAKDYIGPVGWQVVSMTGGWTSICERATNDNISFLETQWRHLIAAHGMREISNLSLGAGEERLQIEKSSPLQKALSIAESGA